jgi:hypothetical protein
LALRGAAPVGGAVVALQSSNSAVAAVPATVKVAAGLVQTSFYVTTSAVSNATAVQFTATYNGAANATLVVEPFWPVQLTISRASIFGTQSATGKVVMNGPALDSFPVVSLSSSNPSAVSVPATVTVPAGYASATFAITTSSVTADTAVTITATCNGKSVISMLTVRPVAPVISMSASAFYAGAKPLVTVSIPVPAPADGALVTVSTSNPYVLTPASDVPVLGGVSYVSRDVRIAAGTTTAPSFAITTFPVAASTTVTLTATYGGVSVSKALTIRPVVVYAVLLDRTKVYGGDNVPMRVRLNVPAPDAGIYVSVKSGDTRVVGQAFVFVPAGAQESPPTPLAIASVAATQSVTLTAGVRGFGATVPVDGNVFTATSKAAVVTVLPPIINGLEVQPNGTGLNLVVKLIGPAPPSGAVVALSSSNPKVVAVPLTVTIPWPDVDIAVPLTLSPPQGVTVQITARYNGSSKTVLIGN